MAKTKKKLSARNMQIIIRFLITINIILLTAVVVLAIMLVQSKNEAASSDDDAEAVMATNSNFIVCIDAGHGGDDTGTIGIDGSYEKDDNLQLALLVQEELADRGVTVIMTRSDDTYVELADRAQIANDADADLFVSLHRNYSESSSDTQGVEIWIHSSGSATSYAAANDILDRLIQTNISTSRGVKSGTQGSNDSNYAVIRETAMTSMIIEMGFMSNEEDLTLFRKNKEAYAKAIADGIVTWLNSTM